MRLIHIPAGKDIKYMSDLLNQFLSKCRLQTPDFLSQLLYSCSSLKGKAKNKIVKFLLFYLADKGYIKFEFTDDNRILILKIAEPDATNIAEHYLINALFPENGEYYVTPNAIVGTEYIELGSALNTMENKLKDCPVYDYVTDTATETMSTVSSPDYHSPGINAAISKDMKRISLIMLFTTVILFFPNAMVACDNDISIIFAYYFVWAIFMVPFGISVTHIVRFISNKVSDYKILAYASDSVKKLVNTFRHILSFGFALTSLFFIIVFACMFAENGRYLLMTIALLVDLLLIIIAAYKLKHRYDLYSPRRTILKKFTSYIRSQISRMRKGKNTDVPGLYTYSLLCSGNKLSKRLLLEEHSKLPTWTNATTTEQFNKLYNTIEDYNR